MKLIWLCFLLAGCASASKFNDLSLGMTKAEVISKLGKPYTTSVNEKGELLKYSFTTDLSGQTDDRYVLVREGRVVRYGTKQEVLDKEDKNSGGPVPVLLSH